MGWKHSRLQGQFVQWGAAWLFLLWNNSILAQGIPPNSAALKLRERAERLFEQEQYSQAHTLIPEVIKLVKNVGMESEEVQVAIFFIAYSICRHADQRPILQLTQSLTQINGRKPVFGETGNQVAFFRDCEAKALAQNKQYAKAEQLVQENVRFSEEMWYPTHANVGATLERLFNLYPDPKSTWALVNRYLNAAEQRLASNLVGQSEPQMLEAIAQVSGTTNFLISRHLGQKFTPATSASAQLATTVVLQRKGRILDLLSQRLGRMRQALTPGDRQLWDQLTALRAQQARLAFSGADAQEIAALERQIAPIEAQFNRRDTAPTLDPTPVTLEAVQARIPRDAVLVEFVQYFPYLTSPPQSTQQPWGDARYAVYILEPQGVPRWLDLGAAVPIHQEIQTFRRNITDPRRSLAEQKESARQLEQRIMAPVRQLLGSEYRHLLIAPDGELNLIPWAALVDEKDRYLVERFTITYLTSGRDLLRFAMPAASLGSMVILADPTYDQPGSGAKVVPQSNLRSSGVNRLVFGSLPGTAAEATALRDLFPNSQVLMGVAATESALKQVRRPSILHLATHGFFLDQKALSPTTSGGENPLLLSGLALAGFNIKQSGQDDGVLTALEVTSLDLHNTQLAVLSACQTGLGDITQGEGVYGLRRAFTLAGAQTQVMSLWSVDDQATKDLMVAYYQRLQRGESRGEALRQVQLQLMQDSRYTKPFFWSGFIISGDWRPLF